MYITTLIIRHEDHFEIKIQRNATQQCRSVLCFIHTYVYNHKIYFFLDSVTRYTVYRMPNRLNTGRKWKQRHFHAFLEHSFRQIPKLIMELMNTKSRALIKHTGIIKIKDNMHRVMFALGPILRMSSNYGFFHYFFAVNIIHKYNTDK